MTENIHMYNTEGTGNSRKGVEGGKDPEKGGLDCQFIFQLLFHYYCYYYLI